MQNSKEWKEFRSELTTFAKWFLSGLIDSVFLVLWVFVQWGTQRLITNLALFGIDVWVFSLFQILFAVSTVAPVVLYIYADIRIMALRMQRRIRREIELDKK
jgi:hypothetical protein